MLITREALRAQATALKGRLDAAYRAETAQHGSADMAHLQDPYSDATRETLPPGPLDYGWPEEHQLIDRRMQNDNFLRALPLVKGDTPQEMSESARLQGRRLRVIDMLGATAGVAGFLVGVPATLWLGAGGLGSVVSTLLWPAHLAGLESVPGSAVAAAGVGLAVGLAGLVTCESVDDKANFLSKFPERLKAWEHQLQS